MFAPLASDVTASTLDAAREQGAVLAYGNFITAVVNFLIVAFILFMVVRSANSMKKKEEGSSIRTTGRCCPADRNSRSSETLISRVGSDLTIPNPGLGAIAPRPGFLFACGALLKY